MNSEDARRLLAGTAARREEIAASIGRSEAFNAILRKYAHRAMPFGKFVPFGDGDASIQVDGLTVENQGDRLVAYDGGTIDVTVTRDREGAALAARLAAEPPGSENDTLRRRKILLGALMAAAAERLSTMPDLPERIANGPATTVANPFA